MGQPPRGDVPLAELGVGQAPARGIPSGAASRYSFRPQYQRESEAQEP
jgi:hypothetical protein